MSGHPAGRHRRGQAGRERPERGSPEQAPATNQVAVAPYRWPRLRSPNGVMVDSIDSPHGDHVERTAAATATTAPAVGIKIVSRVASLLTVPAAPTAHLRAAGTGLVQIR